MIVLKWLGTEQYDKDGKGPVLVGVTTNKRWDWGLVEKMLNNGEDIQILGKEEDDLS